MRERRTLCLGFSLQAAGADIDRIGRLWHRQRNHRVERRRSTDTGRFERTGIVHQNALRNGLLIERPIDVKLGGSYARFQPDTTSRVSVEIEFECAAIGKQGLSVELVDNVFQREIAPARTFGFAYEIQHLHDQGLALGGSVRDAVVIDQGRAVNPEGLRFSDEFARRKLLDCLGNLALTSAPIYGH